jgi:hypothetical protein
VPLEPLRESHIIPERSYRSCPAAASFEEASLAQDVQHTEHDGGFDNVCLTGNVILAAFCIGIALSGVVFWWAWFASHGAG